MAIGLAWSKIVSLSAMFVITMLFAAFAERLVWFLRRRGKGADIDGSFIVHMLNCFAGGLFLGTFLLSLLPEVRELFEVVLVRYGVTSHFPVAEACTGVGFFMVMFVEHLIEMCSGSEETDLHHDHFHNTNPQKKGSASWHLHGHSNDHHDEWRYPKGIIGGLEEEERSTPYDSFRYVKENGEGVESAFPLSTESEVQLNSEARLVGEGGQNNPAFLLERSQLPRHARSELQICQVSNSVKKSASYPNVPTKALETSGQDHHYETLASGSTNKTAFQNGSGSKENTPKDKKKFSLRSMILVLALSMHTLFEGLALGLLDEEAAVWTLMIAITVHKSVIVMAVSIQLCKVETNTIKMVYVHLLVFAIMSPVGIAVGIAVTETGNPDDLVTDTASSILQALATGTFLYVTFYEVLNRELESSPDLRKVLAVILGFAGIIGLKFLELHGGGH